MSFVVAPIVEGHGDVTAVPALIRRIAPNLIVKNPVRFPRSKLNDDAQFERAAQIAASNITDHGAILLVMDADDDCAAKLGPELNERLKKHLPNRECLTALPVREFEAWLVGGIAAFAIENADIAGDLKGRLQKEYGRYKETADQKRLCADVDLELLTRRSRSFRHFLKTIEELRSLSEREI